MPLRDYVIHKLTSRSLKLEISWPTIRPRPYLYLAQRVMSGYRLEDQSAGLNSTLQLSRLGCFWQLNWLPDGQYTFRGRYRDRDRARLVIFGKRSTQLPDRHRNMEAVFEVSWQRLAKAEKLLFAQLCVFRGSLRARWRLQSPALPCISWHLFANKGLIQFEKDSDRYRIHRLLGQFGVNKLSQTPAAAEMIVRKSHCAYFCTALKTWDEQLKGSAQLATLAEMDKESINARAAWIFALKNGQFAELDRAADGLNRYYLWRRRFIEGQTACRLAQLALLQALSAGELSEDTARMNRILAKVQIWQSVFCDRTKADELVGQALTRLNGTEMELEDTRRERAFALQRAGDLAFGTNDDKARHNYHQSLALYRELQDFWGTAKMLTALGWLAAHNGEMEDAKILGEEALALVRASGDCKRTADVLWLLGSLAILEEQIEDAGRYLGESLDIRASLGNRISDIATGPLDLGMILTWIGRFVEADAVRE